MFNHYLLSRFARDHFRELVVLNRPQLDTGGWCPAALARCLR